MFIHYKLSFRVIEDLEPWTFLGPDDLPMALLQHHLIIFVVFQTHYTSTKWFGPFKTGKSFDWVYIDLCDQSTLDRIHPNHKKPTVISKSPSALTSQLSADSIISWLDQQLQRIILQVLCLLMFWHLLIFCRSHPNRAPNKCRRTRGGNSCRVIGNFWPGCWRLLLL